MTQQDFDNLNNQMMNMLENTDIDSLAEILSGNDENVSNQLFAIREILYRTIRTRCRRKIIQLVQSMRVCELKPESNRLSASILICTAQILQIVLPRRNRQNNRQGTGNRSCYSDIKQESEEQSCMISGPGVGKTAIAEGLAVRITNQQVPSKMFDTEVYLLDLAAIVAGTQFRGQFEAG